MTKLRDTKMRGKKLLAAVSGGGLSPKIQLTKVLSVCLIWPNHSDDLKQHGASSLNVQLKTDNGMISSEMRPPKGWSSLRMNIKLFHSQRQLSGCHWAPRQILAKGVVQESTPSTQSPLWKVWNRSQLQIFSGGASLWSGATRRTVYCL
jgi:hypothetical protein